jgi:hypothetical protein
MNTDERAQSEPMLWQRHAPGAMTGNNLPLDADEHGRQALDQRSSASIRVEASRTVIAEPHADH